MNISPVRFNSFRNSAPVSFKGNNDKYEKGSFSDDPIKNGDESKQNNSPEVFISTEQYLEMWGKGITNQMEKTGYAEKISSDIRKSVDNAFEDMEVEGRDFPDFSAMFSDVFSGDMIANTVMFSLAYATNMLDEVPQSKKGKLPVLIEFSFDDFLNTMRTEMDKQKNSSSEVEKSIKEALAAIDTNDSDDEEFSDFGINPLEINCFSGNSAFPSAVDMQEQMYQSFLVSKDKFDVIVKEMSERVNYQFNNVLEAGFNRDPRRAINLLTINEMQYIEPEITDNLDGTSTYKYVQQGDVLEVVRNNNNGDFICAKESENGVEKFSMQFREDGSIEELTYLNQLNNSRLTVTTNLENNKAAIKQESGNCVALRNFERQADGNLKRTSFEMYLKDE